MVSLSCREEVETSLEDGKVILPRLEVLVSECETFGAICWEAHSKHINVVRASTKRTRIIGIARVQDHQAQTVVTIEPSQSVHVNLLHHIGTSDDVELYY